MKTLDGTELTIGQQVIFVDESLNVGGPDDLHIYETHKAKFAGKLAIVVAINDPKTSPGKVIGLCFKDNVKGHSCDGLVPHGHGAWSLASHLYTPEEFARHKQVGGEFKAKRAGLQKVLDQFFGGKIPT